jgi:hypothetical protein
MKGNAVFIVLRSIIMPQRLAAAVALIAFALCLLIGGLEVDNPFTTTVLRALVAMAGTYVIGLMVGAMGQKMLDENLKMAKEKLLTVEKQPKSDR